MCHRDMKWANAVGKMTPRSLLRVITQSRPTLWVPMNCSPPGSSIHGLLQAILEWVAIPFSRSSSQPRDRTQVSCIAGGFFTIQATRDAPYDRYLSHFHGFPCGSFIDLDSESRAGMFGWWKVVLKDPYTPNCPCSIEYAPVSLH